jgi:hypothetical protein
MGRAGIRRRKPKRRLPPVGDVSIADLGSPPGAWGPVGEIDGARRIAQAFSRGSPPTRRRARALAMWWVLLAVTGFALAVVMALFGVL